MEFHYSLSDSIASHASLPGRGRPTWAEISLSTLRANYKSIQKHVEPLVEVCAVVKADAYRHGLVECAVALQAEGARWFGVTSTEEGIELRKAGLRGNILLMTGFWRGDEDEIIEHQLTPAVWELWHFEQLSQAAQRHDSRISVHLKVDTGMGRLGILPRDIWTVISYFQNHSELFLEGIFTHLASAELIEVDAFSLQLCHSCRWWISDRLIRQCGDLILVEQIHIGFL